MSQVQYFEGGDDREGRTSDSDQIEGEMCYTTKAESELRVKKNIENKEYLMLETEVKHLVTWIEGNQEEKKFPFHWTINKVF